MRTSIFLFCTLAALMVLQACENSHEPEPPFTCDPANPTNYTKDVKPVMDASCIFSCHEPGGSYSSIPLTSYAEVKAAVQNKNLLAAIKHEGAYVSMPKDQQKLNQVVIDKIVCWAENGFKN